MKKTVTEYHNAIAMDSEQILRYFVHRDMMNANVHLDNHERGVNVRFSPITLAAERVIAAIYNEFYDPDVIPPTIGTIG